MRRGVAGSAGVRAVAFLLLLPSTVGAESARTLVAFKSPSGNITCVIRNEPDNRFAQCELRSNGRGYFIGLVGRGHTYDGRGYDDLAGQRFVLRYGRSVRLGQFACASRVTGMTCRSLSSGHGFSISRERQRFF
jgi:hypothetical protein